MKYWLQKNWHIIVLLLFFVLLRFYPLLFGKTLLFGDNYSLMVPGKLFFAEWLRQGIVAWWNPHIFGGLSLVGDINQSMFYPSTLFFVFCSPAQALNVTILLHVFLTGLGMFVLTQRLVKNQLWSVFAAVLWMFSTQVSGAINNISTIQSIAWLPWLLWAGLFVPHRFSSQLWFAVFVLVQFLAGYPQHVFFSIMASSVLSLLVIIFGEEVGISDKKAQLSRKELLVKGKKWLVSWLMAGLLSVGLTAFVWWPFLEVLQDSTRSSQTQQQSVAGSLHPIDLLKLISPYIFDNPVAGMKWGPQWNAMPNLSLYVSWFSVTILFIWLLLRKYSRWDYAMLALLVATILFALGGNMPGYAWLQELLPLFKFSRGPSTILMVTNIFLLLWVVSVAQRMDVKKLSKQWLYRILLVGLLVVGVFAVLFWAMGQWQFATIWQFATQLLGERLTQSPFHTYAKDQIIWTQIWLGVAVNSVLGFLALVSWQKQKQSWLIFFIVIDMFWNTRGLFFYAPQTVYKTGDELRVAELLQKLPVDIQSRVLFRNYNAPYTDFGAYWEAITVRKPFSDSYITDQELREFSHLQRYAYGLTPDWNMVAGVSAINGYTTLLPQSVNQTWVATGSANGINNLPEISLNHPALPLWSVRYYVVDTWFPNITETKPLNKVSSIGHWEIYELPALPRFRWGATNAAVIFENFSENPNRQEFTTTNLSSQSQSLLVADRFDRNWRASIDGTEVEVQNKLDQREIMVPPGTHAVLFWFWPERLLQGLFVTIVTLFLALISLVCLTKRR